MHTVHHTYGVNISCVTPEENQTSAGTSFAAAATGSIKVF